MLPGLIEAGIDCIEHGTGLSQDLIDAMVEKRISLVPTVMQIDKFPQYVEAAGAKFPAYAAHMTDLHARQRDTIMAAYDAGVPLFAGSDGGGISRHGNIAGEVVAMAGLGMPAEYALGAASWRAREWLGWNAGLDEGAPADFVVYDSDPREDLSALSGPQPGRAQGSRRGRPVANRTPRTISIRNPTPPRKNGRKMPIASPPKKLPELGGGADLDGPAGSASRSPRAGRARVEDHAPYRSPRARRGCNTRPGAASSIASPVSRPRSCRRVGSSIVDPEDPVAVGVHGDLVRLPVRLDVASVSGNDFIVSTRRVTPTATPATISPPASTNHQALGRRRCGGGGGAP